MRSLSYRGIYREESSLEIGENSFDDNEFFASRQNLNYIFKQNIFFNIINSRSY